MHNLPGTKQDSEEALTCERSREPAWPLSRDGVCIGMLWSGCCCWGVTVDLWELEHQFGGWGGATTGPLFKWPDLCEGNLLWRGGLGVWRRGLRLVATRGATWTRAWTSGGPCIQDDSTSCREEKEWRGEQWAESLDPGGSCSSDVAFIPVCQTCRIIHVIITGSPCFLGQKKHCCCTTSECDVM